MTAPTWEEIHRILAYLSSTGYEVSFRAAAGALTGAPAPLPTPVLPEPAQAVQEAPAAPTQTETPTPPPAPAPKPTASRELPEGVLPCPCCPFGARTTTALRKHITMRHPEQALRCDDCGYVGETHRAVTQHRYRNHRQTPTPPPAPETTVYSLDLVTGVATPTEYASPDPTPATEQLEDLPELTIEQDATPAHACPTCPRTFPNKSALRDHVYGAHPRMPANACTQCERSGAQAGGRCDSCKGDLVLSVANAAILAWGEYHNTKKWGARVTREVEGKAFRLVERARALHAEENPNRYLGPAWKKTLTQWSVEGSPA